MNRVIKLVSSTCIALLITTAALRAGDIHDAAAAGDLSKVRALIEADPALLESTDNMRDTPLHKACFAGQVAVANYLIDKGANVNVRDNFQQTPLHRACYFPNTDLSLVKRLIDKGADINMKGSDRSSPLHWAAYKGGLEVAKFLLDRGAAVNAQGYNGLTPLHRAAQSGDLQVAELLIDHGADPNSYDNYSGATGPSDISGTALQVAINLHPKQDMAKLLVERGAKLNRKDSSGNTELHLAALKGYTELTRLLVKHGADVHAVNAFNRTALYYAAKHGYRSVAEVLIVAGTKESSVVETNYGKAPQLSATLKEGEAYLWDFYYLGFAVKTKAHLILFNPGNINDSSEAGLANGHLNPNELAGLKITALITEPALRQSGRADSAVELAKRLPGADFVLGFKPDASSSGSLDPSSYRVAASEESFSVGGVLVHAIPAMGGGMGYLVEADGVKVFHSGLHVSSNKASEMEEYRKEIDFLKPFGPIDIVILSVYGHNNRVGTAYEPYLYLLDQLSPKAIHLQGANNPEQYPKCSEVLRARNIPVAYPEGGRARGERFHYLRE